MFLSPETFAFKDYGKPFNFNLFPFPARMSRTEHERTSKGQPVAEAVKATTSKSSVQVSCLGMLYSFILTRGKLKTLVQEPNTF